MYGNYGTPGVPLVPAGGAGGIPRVPLSEPTQVFRYGEQSIWSTVLLPQAAIASSINRCFATALGGTGQGFTRAMTIGETNIKEGGRIPNGVAYDVFGISAHIMAGSAANDNAGNDFDTTINTDNQIQNLTDLLNNGVLTWDFTQTQVDIAPLILCGSGGGVFGSVGVVANNEQRVGHLVNGNGSVWMYRKHPVALPGNTTFAVLLRIGSRASALQDTVVGVKITLMGYYKNVIEIG